MTVAPIPAQPSAPQALAMGLKYGPNAGVALQRSQYLADALASMQANAAQNSRTPAALAANLLAEGLAHVAKGRADKQAMTAYSDDQKAQLATLLAGTPLDESATKPALPAPTAPQTSAAPTSLGSLPQATPQPELPAQASGGINYSPSDREALARMIAGEARGEGPDGMAAAGSVALNRLQQHYRGAKSLADVVYAPHQFSGMDQGNALPPGQMAPAYQVADGLLSGQVADPTHGATSFLNPTLQVQQGHAIPAWAQGQGQQIGHHVFYGGSPQAEANAEMASHQMPQDAMSGGGDPQHPPQAPQLPGGGTLAYTPPQQQAPGPQPYQIASNGPTPPPPSSPAGAAPAAPSPLPGPAAGAGVPHQVVTPEEWQTAAALLHDPRTRDLGVQELIKLKMRAAAPVDMKPGVYWGPDGHAHSVEQFQDVQGAAPNAFVQRSNLDNSIHAQSNPAYGSVPASSVMTPEGAISRVPTQQEKPFRISGAPGFYVHDENGQPKKVADDNFTVKDVAGLMQEITASPQYDKATKLTEMYRGAAQAAQRPGGISDAELKDNAAQIFSGGVARQFNSKMIDEGQGPLLRLKQFGPEIMSGQRLSPQARQAILMAMKDYVTESQGAFHSLAESKRAFAAQQGQDISPFLAPLVRSIPDVPDLTAIPTGIGGYGTPAPAPAANPMHPQTPQDAATLRQQAIAEVARRKAAGHWPGH